MHTHISREYRRLAFISLIASLCSIGAIELAGVWNASPALDAATSTEVSFQPGDLNLTGKDLKSFQSKKAIEQRAADKKKVQKLRAAPSERAHQARTRK